MSQVDVGVALVSAVVGDGVSVGVTDTLDVASPMGLCVRSQAIASVVP